MDDRAAFAKMLMALGEVYSKRVSEILVGEYWDSLCPFNIDDILHAKSMLKIELTRFPTIAEFVTKIHSITQHRTETKTLEDSRDHRTPEEIDDAAFARTIFFEDWGSFLLLGDTKRNLKPSDYDRAKIDATLAKRKGMTRIEICQDITSRINALRVKCGEKPKFYEIG